MKKFVLSLTLFRIIAGPLIFVMIIFFQYSFLALFVFIAASLSDFLDGKLARSYEVETSLGAVLDPIADKILILFTLFSITIITKDPFVGMIASLILAREFWVSGLREFAAKGNLSSATKVTFLAKTKTSVQFTSILFFFVGFELSNALIIFLASFLLFLSLLISIKTAIQYSENVFKVNKD